MTTYRCTDPACQHGIIWQRIGDCPRCGKRLEPIPPKRLARPATPALDQLAGEQGGDPDELSPAAKAEHRATVARIAEAHGFSLPTWQPKRPEEQPEQLAIDELTVPWDEWVRGLSAEGGQAR